MECSNPRPYNDRHPPQQPQLGAHKIILLDLPVYSLQRYICLLFLEIACITSMLYRLLCGVLHSRITDFEPTFLEWNFLLCHGRFGESRGLMTSIDQGRAHLVLLISNA